MPEVESPCVEPPGDGGGVTSWRLKLACVWGGELVSILTSSILQMGFIWHITLTTGAASMLSLASLMGFLPLALFGMFAGAIVDRLSVKHVLIGADLFIAAVSAAVAVVALVVDVLPVWVVIVALFFRAIGSAFHTPAAQTLTPLVAPPEHLTRLSGVMQGVQSGGYIAGTAIAAVIYPTLGLTAMIALDVAGALFATGAILVAAARPAPSRHPRRRGRRSTVSGRWRAPTADGAASARPGLLDSAPRPGGRDGAGLPGAAASTGASLPFCGAGLPSRSCTRPSRRSFHHDDRPLRRDHGRRGAAEIVFAVGMMAGSALLAATGGFRNRALSVIVATAAYGAGDARLRAAGAGRLRGVSRHELRHGVSSPFYAGPQTALMQERIPPEVLGRLFGLYGSIMAWAMPVGLAFSSLFADAVGAPAWFVGGGCGDAHPCRGDLAHPQRPSRGGAVVGERPGEAGRARSGTMLCGPWGMPPCRRAVRTCRARRERRAC